MVGAQNITLGTQMTEIIGKLQDAMKSGIITADEYDNIIKEISGTNGLAIPTIEQLTIAQNALNEIYRDSIIAADQTAESMIAQSIAAKQAEEANKKAATAQQEVADATNNADAAMRSYSESLLFKIASEGLSAEAAYDLAVKMGLVDQNTVAATKQVNIYKQLLDGGIITQAQYNKLVKDLAEDIENLPEGKRLEIDHNIDDVMADLAELERRKIDMLPVKLSLDTSAIDSYNPPAKFSTVFITQQLEEQNTPLVARCKAALHTLGRNTAIVASCSFRRLTASL